MKKITFSTLILSVGAIAFFGYALMHALVYIMPMSVNSNTAIYIVFTLAIIALGLFIPYAMLKTGMHTAHKYNNTEKEVELADIPKDKQQMAHSIDASLHPH